MRSSARPEIQEHPLGVQDGKEDEEDEGWGGGLRSMSGARRYCRGDAPKSAMAGPTTCARALRLPGGCDSSAKVCGSVWFPPASGCTTSSPTLDASV